MKILGVSILFFCCVSAVISAKAQQKPNILWITIEDTSPQFIGCYGNKDARTPTIDRLAKEGIRFTNAFSTGTVCSPSRTALITGVKTYEAGTGNHRSSYPVPAYIHGFPYYLKEKGYYTSNNSKTDYNVKDPKSFIEQAWDESSNQAGWWKRSPGQPFFAVFNIMDSHQSRTMTDSYPQYVKEVLDQMPKEEHIGEKDFKMPPFYKDSPEMRKQMARVYNAIHLTDNKIAAILDRLEQDNLRDSTIIFFFADHGEGIPRGKTNGINLGYRVPFVLWIPPMYAHLNPWGKQGIITEELVDFTDLAPTLISIAGGIAPAHMTGRAILGAQRKPTPDHLILSSDRSDNGIDMVRTLTDGRYIYSRNYMPYMPEARYIRYMEIGDIKQQMRQDLASGKLNPLQTQLFTPRPAESLYDIQNDLWETKNLMDDPALESKARRLKTQLGQELTRSRDVLFLPEYEIAKISEQTSPYEFRQEESRYPFKEIYAAASWSGIRNAKAAKKQIALLKDKNKIVRYWAAVGLRSQTAATLRSYQKELIAAIQDEYPPVQALISALCFDHFKEDEAEKTLKLLCLSEQRELALMAINELLYLNNRRPFVETVKAKHASLSAMPKSAQAGNYEVKAACMDVLGSLGLVANNPDFKE
ncbi:sulfatase family protein [Dyadobacter tibetensis]|uniref:sulfatase family protein n=1 Tax=Dyadobacter tibetensis TaxID=1211851 RepID=UPI000472A76B|nr:sulfatase [Dyadobacter tibetensis]